MINVLGTILAFFIVFFVVTFVHEFGHFFMARLFGVRVEVFSFGIGPRLLGVQDRRFSFGKAAAEGKGTDYRISLVPIICYVKLFGEGMFEPGRPIAPDDLMAKNRFQRFLIMGMGPVMNLLLAVVLVAAINGVGTKVPEYLEKTPVIGYIEPDSPAKKADLRVGDTILSVAGHKVRTWNDVEMAIGTRPDRLLTIEVRRDGETLPVELKTEAVTKYEMGYAGFQPEITTEVDRVLGASPAEKAGLEPGDVILDIDGQRVYYYKFLSVIQKSAGKELVLTVDRHGRLLNLTVTPRLEGTVGRIGIAQIPRSVEKRYSFFPAIGHSLHKNLSDGLLLVRIFRGFFTGETSVRQLGGPQAIADFSYTALQMGLGALVSWIAFLSLQLGVINLILPVPIADGFQMGVLTLEAIFRRDLSPKIRMALMTVGWVMVLLLTAFVILNDFVKKLPNGWHSLLPF